MFTFATHKYRIFVLSCLVVATLFSNAIIAQIGTWGTITTLAPHTNAGVLLVLTDGSILCKTSSGGGNGNIWDRLTPVNGSYKNGTWTSIAAMHNDRLYFSSQVLPDGRVYVCGGEYGAGGAYGEIWDPKTNVWTVAGGPTWVFPNVVSDANSEILYDGKVLQACVDEAGVNWNYLWDPVTNTYVRGPNCLRVDNEGTWVKLPDSSIVFLDNYSTTSERYMPKTNTWINDGVSPVNLYDPFGSECGGAFLLPDGRAFFIGSTPNTAYYTPTGTTAPGTWTAGPNIPGGYGATDAPAVIMPNGHILLTVSPAPTASNHFPSPTEYFEFDYLTNTFTQVNAPAGGLTSANACYIGNMVDLPDGTVLFANQGSNRYYQYTPGSGGLAAGKPTIASVNRVNCDTFQAVGTLFNGISEGSAYGDDWQEESNYPIIRLNDAAGNITYTTTYNWNRIGAVMTGTLPDTCIFAIPATLAPGTYSVTVVANGNPSAPFRINTSLTITPSPVSICVGTSLTLSDSSSIGVWSSANTAVATVGASTGVVTGTGVGTTTVSYSIGQCHASVSVSVNAGASPILGTLSVCVGGTTSLSDALPGGTWSSSSTNATVGTSGLVSGVTAGTAMISYVAPSGCVNTAVVTVNAATATITPVGSTSVCAPATVVLNANTGAGLTYQWQVGGSPITGATTSSYTASLTGTYNVVVSGGPACTATSLPVVVTVGPTVLPITGTFTVCANSTTQLTDLTTGGTWLSSSPAAASVGIGTGLVTSGFTASTITVTITYTAPAGCAVTQILTIYPAPAAGITATGATTFCSGGSVLLTANTGAGLTYQWQLGGTPILGATNLTYTATLGGNYTVVVYNPLGCNTTSIATPVTVGTPPGATITPLGSTTFCTGGSVVLNANTGTGYTYQWQLGGGNIGGATGSSYTATLGGDYTVIVSSTGCNSTSAITTVTITGGPGATITPAGPTTFCAGGNVVLNANTGAGMTYQWLLGGTPISGATSSAYTATATGNYAVIVTQGSCIATSAITSVNVIVAPTAVITPAGLTTFCSGGSVVLNATAGAGYTYQWQLGGSDIAGATSSSYTATLGGNYTVVISSGGCSATSAVTTITVITSPGATITPAGPTTFCAPGSVVLNATVTAGVAYQWQLAGTNITGATTSSYTATTGGDYNVVITYGPCVVTSAITTVTVLTVPTVSAISGANNVCVGAATLLTDATASGTWSSGSTGVATVDVSGNVTGASAGTVTLSYTLANACGSSSSTYLMTVNAATPLSPITGGTNLCVGQTSALSESVTGGVWSSFDPTVATVSAGGLATGIAVGATPVSYQLTNAAGCVSAAVVTVNVVAVFASSITAASNTTFCTGGYVGLNATLGAGYTYQWQVGGVNIPGATSSSYIASTGGNYTVVITNATGCPSTSAGVLVVVNPTPIVVPSVTVTGDLGTVLCGTTAVETFSASPTNGGTTPAYQWYVNGSSTGTGGTYTYSPATGDVVKVVLTSSDICAFPDTAIGTLTMTISPILTPSVSITSIHQDSTCTGDTVQFISVPVYGGTAPTYLWTENGINVATGPYYIYTPLDGDTLILTMTSNQQCLTTNVAVSEMFIIHVFPPVANSLAVSVSQSSIVAGSVDTFTAIASGAGTSPSFQWFIDGVPVPGATSYQYITDSLQNGQVVNCEETSSFVCSNPPIVVSGGITIDVVANGVKAVGYNSGNFTLVPNPNNGEFTIKGKLKSATTDKVNITVTNVLGQSVYKKTVLATNGILNEQIALDKTVAAGTYQVSLTSGEERAVFHVVIEK